MGVDPDHPETKASRYFLQRGSIVEKRNDNDGSFERVYLWLSEDLLQFRWSFSQKSDLRKTLNVINIKSISPVDASSFSFNLKESSSQPLIFRVEKVRLQSWMDCCLRLCQGKLAYQLLWDQSDIGCEISIHWIAENQWFFGVIRGFNDDSNMHVIEYNDGKERTYSLHRKIYRVERLPEWRRDKELYDGEGSARAAWTGAFIQQIHPCGSAVKNNRDESYDVEDDDEDEEKKETADGADGADGYF